ncbi:MAG: glycosyltransferase family 2 protein [Acidaminococcales bacterium]|jgi:glycosyltransferase involved in cell wall biosynthesis|nr:glycosyltransferase family 2 protein [Acidaminococcales bacterium]
MDLSVVILTFNEERHVAETIASARQVAEEIIVVDSGSTDKTVEMARAAGAKVFFRAWDGDFAAQRNFGTEQATADFVFHLDADERISPELAASVKQAAAGHEQKIFAFYRKNLVFGRLCQYGEMKPDIVKRLYPRAGAQWEGKVHENLRGSLPTAMCKGALYHRTYEDWELFLNKVNKYTTIWAEAAKGKGKKTSLAAAAGHGFFAFFKGFVIKRGFLGGFPILVTCCMHAFYTMLKYLKLFQIQDK